MTRLVWDQADDRFYENGVSQGVFYGSDRKGIPWNGLSAVEESNNDNLEPLYFDGLKYGDIVTIGDFEGKIKAFTYPDEFLPYEGVAAWEPGFYLTNQTKKRFGLSYKTEINNGQSSGIGYKIHLIYNVIAVPSDKVYQTLSLNSDPTDFEWAISAIPEQVDRFRPTAHIVIDSRKIDPLLLIDIENIIYGTDEVEATLPDLNALVRFVQKWGRFIVTDNGDGTWTATSPLPGAITMLDSTTFEITSDTAIVLTPDTYELSSSAEEEV
jgi:hypothetical protein